MYKRQVYAYAVETAIQLTLTELNENLREIYIEAYSLPDTSEYIYLHTTAELQQIFSANFQDYSDSDFYEMEIGTAGLMRNYICLLYTSCNGFHLFSVKIILKNAMALSVGKVILYDIH